MLAFFEKLLKDSGLLVSFLWRIIGFFLADEMQNGADWENETCDKELAFRC